MHLKKSELYSSLWQSCDELRAGMDASQSIIRSLTIPFPSLAEQTAIATIFSVMDAEIAGLEAKLEKARPVKAGISI